MSDNKFNTNKLFALSSENETYEFSLPLTKNTSIDGEEQQIVLEYDNESGIYYIFYNGNKYPVELIKKQQNKYEIVFNNISRVISVETPFSLDRMRKLEATKPKNEKSLLKAPMPGKIINIVPGEGSRVQRGETIVILEAMKMENEILSPINGIVTKITVRPNDNVMGLCVIMYYAGTDVPSILWS